MRNTAHFSSVELQQLFAPTTTLPHFECTSVSTDSRTLEKHALFVALVGERFDAHDAIEDVVARGAGCVIVEERREKEISQRFPDLAVIGVANTLHALGALGAYHRKRFSFPVVAVAGAAGKTSTKELTAHVLSTTHTVLKTSANYNNQVGTPLTLLQLSNEYSCAVIEIGTNEPGEIEILSAMVQPTHGVITNIGKEHLEKLIDIDGVEQEETALFRYLVNSGGVALINCDDERLARYATLPRAVSFSTSTAATVRGSISFTSELYPAISFTVDGKEYSATVYSVGFAWAINALCAISVAYAVGVSPSNICKGLETFTTPAAHGYARMLVEQMGSCTVINDCYNANPESMLMALKTLRAFPCTGKRIALLGDMRELGDSSAEEHKLVVSSVLEYCDVAVLVGNEMHQAAQHVMEQSNKIVLVQKEDAAKKLTQLVSEGDVMLVKASRGIALETVLQEFSLLVTT